MIRRVACAVALLWGAQAVAVSAGDTVRIGSKGFTESRMLAELMAETIRRAVPALQVELRGNLGGTVVTHNALRSGAIDMYAEYTGTAWYVLLQRTDAPESALHAFAATQRGLAAEGVRALPPFGFNNTYGLLVRTEIAEARDLHTISDLAARGGDLRLATSHEFGERSDGWPALAAAYGLENAISFNEHELLYGALQAGELDVMEVYTTDGKLATLDGRLLQDDKNFFPPYHAVPLLRADTVRQYPQVEEALLQLAWRLDNATMQCLNARADATAGDYHLLAADFLDGKGCVLPETQAPILVSAQKLAPRLVAAMGVHLVLTLATVLAAVGIGVPLGIWATRNERVGYWLFGIINIMQTLPVLALLALFVLVPFLGLGMRSALLAMLFYALLPLVRNTYTGIKEISRDLIETAVGLGMTPMQILWRVELPLAVPFLLAGVRTATVVAVGMATIAAFVGAGGLGDLILTGLQLARSELIWAGAVPAMLLALALDAGLGRLQKAMTARGLG